MLPEFLEILKFEQGKRETPGRFSSSPDSTEFACPNTLEPEVTSFL
jgi:hypothetical protein